MNGMEFMYQVAYILGYSKACLENVLEYLRKPDIYDKEDLCDFIRNNIDMIEKLREDES